MKVEAIPTHSPVTVVAAAAPVSSGIHSHAYSRRLAGPGEGRGTSVCLFGEDSGVAIPY